MMNATMQQIERASAEFYEMQHSHAVVTLEDWESATLKQQVAACRSGVVIKTSGAIEVYRLRLGGNFVLPPLPHINDISCMRLTSDPADLILLANKRVFSAIARKNDFDPYNGPPMLDITFDQAAIAVSLTSCPYTGDYYIKAGYPTHFYVPALVVEGVEVPLTPGIWNDFRLKLATQLSKLPAEHVVGMDPASIFHV